MDMEKVIKAIETHTDNSVGCYGCVYKNDPLCMTKLLTDVLALLKEQKAQIKQLKKDLKDAEDNPGCFGL